MTGLKRGINALYLSGRFVLFMDVKQCMVNHKILNANQPINKR